MPTNTSKFNLVKPLKSEKYNVDVFNGNADIIDSQIYSKTEVDTALNGKAPLVHTHPISEVTNLQTALDGKANTTTTVNNQPLSSNITINASDVPNTPAGNISATNVQNAINELDTEKVDKLFATNIVTNGDFSNGTTGWVASGAPLLAGIQNNSLHMYINNTSGATVAQNVSQAIQGVVGNIYYVAFGVSNNTTGASASTFFQFGSQTVFNYTGNGRRSGVFTANNNATSIFFNNTVPNNVTLSLNIDNVLLLNLTATFGAGREPTKEQMDWLLSIYPNSWFNGTRELINYRQLLDRVFELDTEKANTVHTHPISEVTNLQTALDGKANTTTTVNNQPLSSNITINASDVPNTPAGNISATNVQNAINELDTEKADKTYVDAQFDYLKSRSAKVYGVRRVLGATSPTLERLSDSVGKVVEVPIDDSVVTDELNVYPWSSIKECIIDSNGRIWYKGEVGYGSVVGDHMVELPVFWYRIVQTSTVRDEYISDMPLPDFNVPQLFMREDGTVIPKVYVARYKTSKVGGVGADVSRPLEHPENFRNLASFRTGAIDKGSGWQQIDIWYTFVLHLLYRVKYANLNSQNILSNGFTSGRYNADDTAQIAETSVNRIVVLTTVAGNFGVGLTIAIGTSLGSTNIANRRQITAINAINGTQSEIVFDGAPVNISVGNIVWIGAQRTGQTAGLNSLTSRQSGTNGRRSFKLFGIEDAFGNVYEWVDGLIINNLVGHVCRNRSQYASAINASYKPLGYTNSNTNGYPLEMGYDSNNEEAQLPVQIGAGSTTGYADFYVQATGLRFAFFGGDTASGAALAGLFGWFLDSVSNRTSFSIGGRLLFKPPVH